MFARRKLREHKPGPRRVIRGFFHRKHHMSNETKETRSDAIERRIDKTVSADTAISNGNMAFRNVAQIMEFAKVMAVAGVAIPKHLRDTPGACMAVCIQAAEWQMSPFAVANKSYSVNDRLAYEAQLVNAVILRRAPIQGRFKISYAGEGDKRRCRVAAKLNDGSNEEVEYESPEIGKIPVKNSPLWKGDPDQQLFYYSSRAMCRRHFPDVILGIYTQDELMDLPDEREAKGREVPAAKVPLLPGVPAHGRGLTPKEDAAAMMQDEFSAALTPVSEFWERVSARGWDRQRLLNALFEAAWIKSDAEEDFTEAEAAKSLAAWSDIAEMMGGAA